MALTGWKPFWQRACPGRMPSSRLPRSWACPGTSFTPPPWNENSRSQKTGRPLGARFLVPFCLLLLGHQGLQTVAANVFSLIADNVGSILAEHAGRLILFQDYRRTFPDSDAAQWAVRYGPVRPLFLRSRSISLHPFPSFQIFIASKSCYDFPL